MGFSGRYADKGDEEMIEKRIMEYRYLNKEAKGKAFDDLQAYIHLYFEMFDFINRISGEMLRNDFVLDDKWYDQAIELIKKAKI